ncbi:hypothetical protein TruAng_011869 [Truncatella angustata]|nr:hypothetical protein TruAng_011869 [Truncatella angustata]
MPACLTNQHLLNALAHRATSGFLVNHDIALGFRNQFHPGEGVDDDKCIWITDFTRLTNILLKHELDNMGTLRDWLFDIVSCLPDSWFIGHWKDKLLDGLINILLESRKATYRSQTANKAIDEEELQQDLGQLVTSDDSYIEVLLVDTVCDKFKSTYSNITYFDDDANYDEESEGNIMSKSWALSQSPMTKESSSHIQFWQVFPPRWFFPAGGSNITCFHLHQFDGHRTATGTMFKPEDCGLMGRIAMDGDVFRRNRGWILTKIIWQRQHGTAIAWIGTSWLKPACIFAPVNIEQLSFAVTNLAECGVKFAVRGGGYMPIASAKSIHCLLSSPVVTRQSGRREATGQKASPTIPRECWRGTSCVISWNSRWGRLSARGSVETGRNTQRR